MQVAFHTGYGVEKINKVYLRNGKSKRYAPIIRRFTIICVSNWHLSRTISLHSRAKYLAAAKLVSLKCLILESTHSLMTWMHGIRIVRFVFPEHTERMKWLFHYFT